MGLIKPVKQTKTFTLLQYYFILKKMQIKFFAPLILLIAVANSSPLVQNKELVDAEKEIRAQLTTFFEGENVADAKKKAKDVSDRIVKIYDDAQMTLTEKAQKVREVVEEAAGQVNKKKLDDALTNIMAKITKSYAPYLESLKENETFQKGWSFVKGLLE